MQTYKSECFKDDGLPYIEVRRIGRTNGFRDRQLYT